MRAITIFAAASAAFGIAPFVGRLGTLVGSVVLVALGVLLALAASGILTALAVSAGAVGAFASGVTSGTAPALAGAILVALCFAERTVRVRDKNAKLVHVGLALASGAIAGYLSLRYAGAELAVRGVVVMVCAVLAALPLLVPADDPLAFAFDAIAKDVAEPSRTALREGAELRRSVDDSVLDRATLRDARGVWQGLLRLAEARAKLERMRRQRDTRATARGAAVLKKLDERIQQHVATLSRMYVAVDAANAVNLSLDSSALERVESTESSLDETNRALLEELEHEDAPPESAATEKASA